MRRPIIAGNWKMFTTPAQAFVLVDQLCAGLPDPPAADVVVAPPFTHLAQLAERLAGHPIALAAQNLHWEESGPFTGEISAPMLRAVGCRYVIVGHSERRQHFLETDQTVNRKIRAALHADLTPILCFGESLEEREAGQTMTRVAQQLEGGLEGLTASEVERLVLAYEPIWAIGTGKTATEEQAQEVHAFIRAYLTQHYSPELAGTVRIQYGGSVKPQNAAQLLAQPDIDGCLVGGASLSAESFLAIIQAAWS
ncbi:MAG: triose-phosphate isomerase [Bradymonadales bacterium]|nr:triose-phosphate isomerase [Bradymonadales bacterium]